MELLLSDDEAPAAYIRESDLNEVPYASGYGHKRVPVLSCKSSGGWFILRGSIEVCKRLI
jgi:hypothetical protein